IGEERGPGVRAAGRDGREVVEHPVLVDVAGGDECGAGGLAVGGVGVEEIVDVERVVEVESDLAARGKSEGEARDDAGQDGWEMTTHAPTPSGAAEPAAN